MTAVRNFNTLQEAYIAKGMLESAGINCEVSESAMSSIFPGPGGGVGLITLYVEDEKAAEADRLLAEHDD